MVRPVGAVTLSFVTGRVEYDVAWKGNVCIVLFPATYGVKQSDLTLTAAFCGDNICEAAFDGCCADKSSTPLVGVLNQITMRKRLVGII